MSIHQFCVVILLLCEIVNMFCQYPPEQIHIAVGKSPDAMTFNWLTFDYPIITKSVVKVGLTSKPDGMNITNTGLTTLFTDSGTASLHTNRTIHTVNISNLLPSTQYYYQIGDPIYGWSQIFSFKTQPNKNTLIEHGPYKFILFGGLGNYNALCLNAMTEECLDGNVDLILFFGDMSYQLHDNNGTFGDQFMRMLQPMGSTCPIMVSPGNHEAAYNFSHYTERWRGMPNPGPTINGHQVRTYNGLAPNNWYYSFNVGEIHIVSISTEIYFEQRYLIEQQNEWLKNDLIAANKNRSLAPWIFVQGHRPLYCSSKCGQQCTNDTILLKANLEELFFQQGVDFYFSGHAHNYERMYDIYQNKTNKLTTNMTATTYIVSGAVGTCAYNSHCCPFFTNKPVWSAIRSLNYTYTRFHVYNQTHIKLQQVLYDGVTIIDELWYEQHNHGPFNPISFVNRKQSVINEPNDNNQPKFVLKTANICKNFVNTSEILID